MKQAFVFTNLNELSCQIGSTSPGVLQNNNFGTIAGVGAQKRRL